MFTVTVGRTFLDAYNEKYKQSYTPSEFFDQVYFDLFFNHSKYLHWPQNSPFVQGLSSYKNDNYAIRETLKDDDGKTKKFKSNQEAKNYVENYLKGRQDIIEIKSATEKGIKILKSLNQRERQIMLETFHQKVSNGVLNNEIDASIALGFPASESEEFATTSGLVSDLNFEQDIDDIYLSWIGTGLSIGVGEFSILFNKPDILLKTFEGWKVYRKFLNNSSIKNLTGKQIFNWNGQWLNYIYDDYSVPDPDFSLLNEQNVFKTSSNNTSMETIKWSKLFFNLAKNFSSEISIAYVFKFGKTNKTLGFFPFHFNEGKSLINTYKRIFGENAALRDAKQYEQIYGKHIKLAWDLGAIGIQALEPAGLSKYFNPEEMPSFKKKKNEKQEYEKNTIPFRTFKTWLYAMISKNKEEMVDYTATIAKTLKECADLYRKNKEGKTKISNEIKALLSSPSKENFINRLADLTENQKFVREHHLEIFNELKNRVHLSTHTDFKYLLTLIKFDYAYQNRIS